MRKILFICSLVIVSTMMIAGNQKQKLNEVEINGSINVDFAENFNYDSLTALIQYRKDKVSNWVSAKSTFLDSNGKFSAYIPNGSWVSIQVATSDPTIISSNEGSEAIDFYTLRTDAKKVVFWKEEYISAEVPFHKSENISLLRGGALSICEVENIKKGYIQLINRELNPERSLIFSFENNKILLNNRIGGIESGIWEITYFDESDLVKDYQVVKINKGQLLQLDCNNLKNQ